MEIKIKKGAPAGFLIRVAARLLDNLILLLLMLFLGVVMAVILRSKELMIPVIYGLMFLVPGLYFTITTALWGQTAGKKVFNLQVTRVDGRPLSFLFALWRWISEFFSSMTFGLGYLLVLILSSKRALHDFAADTKVVHVGPYNENIMILMLIVPFGAIPITGILAAIAIPRFAQSLEKAREGATKGNLRALKSGIGLYYADNPGKWPADLEKDLVPKYIDKIPPVKATGAFVMQAKSPAGGIITPAGKNEVPTTSGNGWLYDSALGKIYVNSTVHDSKGVAYSFYGFE